MLKKLLGIMTFLSILLCYQNCAMSSHMQVDGESLYSVSGGGCDDILKNAFGKTYYSTFRNKCVSCHDNGAGNGYFANSNFDVAAAAFVSKGRAKVEGNLINAGHQPGHTGPENQPLIDASKDTWAEADAEYASCQARTNPTFTTTPKANAGIYTVAPGGAFSLITWNLSVEIDPSVKVAIPVTVSLQVRRAVSTGTTVVGYEFGALSAHLNAGVTGTYNLKGLRIVLNDQILTGMTKYTLLDYYVDSQTDTVLQAGATGLAVLPSVNPGDVFALNFNSAAAGVKPVITAPPVTTPPPVVDPLPTTMTFTQLISTDGKVGIFNSSCISCHSSSKMSGGLNLTDYAAASAVATTINARINNPGNPMPPSGLLQQRSRDIVNVWVTTGTPQ